ncbi:MAG: hypothetical protein QW292_11295 [Candidatus Parvarchaeota archaeon]
MEDKNVRAVIDIALSGILGYPENVLFDVPSSEGKKTIITNDLPIFPGKYVTVLRDANPKSFTH